MRGIQAERLLKEQASPAHLLRRLILIGGGTGGHLIPGLALAERALERFPGLGMTFFRTKRHIEGRVFDSSSLSLEIRELDLPPPGRRPWTLTRFLFKCMAAEALVRFEIRKDRPDVLVALGGYTSLPGILAARRERIPLVLLEQNRVPGKVVRRFSRWAVAVACPDEGVVRRLRGMQRNGSLIVPTGNPLRKSVLSASELRRSRNPGQRDRRTIVVVGGSQGAQGINRAIRLALPTIREYREKIFWVHVAGNADKEAMAEAYREEGWKARVYDFTPDLPDLLVDADLVITRAGGIILSEVAAIGVPAILVPYPYHRDRHQYQNAEALVEAGAAQLVPEERLKPQAIAEILRGVLFHDAKLLEMEKAARAVSRPGATDAILDMILRVAGGTVVQ